MDTLPLRICETLNCEITDVIESDNDTQLVGKVHERIETK